MLEFFIEKSISFFGQPPGDCSLTGGQRKSSTHRLHQFTQLYKEGRLPHAVKYGRKLISRADLDAYKQRMRPNGEKPRGRPKKMETREVEYRGYIIRLSRTSIWTQWKGQNVSENTYQNIQIFEEGVNEKPVKEMRLDIDEEVSLDELEQAARGYIDGL